MRLALAILLLNTLPLALHGQADNQHQQARRETQNKQNQAAGKKPLSPNAAISPQEHPDNTVTNGGKENPDPPWYKKPEWVAVGLTAIYVGITGWYAVVSHRTMNQIVRQANIADKAADAAQKSANALINSERAWIMVDLEWSPGLSGPQQTTNDSFEPFTSVPFRLRCCNDGKTPGWILEKRACAQIVDRIPTEPDLSRLHTIRFGAEPVRVGKEAVPLEVAIGCSGHIKDGQTLIIYGVVTYRDTFNEKRDTFWGYYWSPNGGPNLNRIIEPGYNKNT
jgi:hypothetical protein